MAKNQRGIGIAMSYISVGIGLFTTIFYTALVNKVLGMPLEQVVVFRRGFEPFESKRYQTLEDPIYQKVIEGGTGDYER